jgi:mitochondrial fission protein ELM1
MAPAQTTWVLTDGRIGNERQALALAHALSDEAPRIWRLDARAPWRWVAPRLLHDSARAFGEEFHDALRAPPTLAIGCGRQAALATRLLRMAGARSVQILDPRIDPHHWDAVVVPEHDALRGANVVTALTSLHAIDADWLVKARAQFPQFSVLPSPRTLLLLGGPIANAPLHAAWWRNTAEVLHAHHQRDGGSLSICASPRAPAWLTTAARNYLSDVPGARWFDASDGPNPYAGLLAWAEHIVVTPDSVNMLSEAVATSASVRVASPELAHGRHAMFLHALTERGRVRSLDADGVDTDTTPLIELPRVAAALRELLRL